MRHRISKKSVKSGKISGNGEFAQKNADISLKKQLKFNKTLLTTSCTDALEMSAISLDLKPGDEVIMPSFTFVAIPPNVPL